jgi:hypothetical protein
MARNTLEAVFGAVGAGLTGYGQSERQKREEEERRRRESFDRAINLDRLGYQPEDQARLGAQQRTQEAAALARSAPTGMPGFPGSAVGRALEAAATRPPDIARGRQLTVDGQTYVQPFSESRAGIRAQEATLQQAQEERTAARRAAEEEREAKRSLESQRRGFAQQAEQGRLDRESRERIAGMTGTGAGGRTSRGMVARDILPTVARNAQVLSKISDADVLQMSPASVWGASTAPLMMTDPTKAVPTMVGAGLNLVTGRMGSGQEQQYALMLGSVSDAAARIGEAVGVLTNQDVARYRAQVIPIPGDTDETRVQKHQNVVSWANFLSRLGQVAASGRELSAEEIDMWKAEAAQLGAGTDERVLLETWSRSNPQDPNERNRDYIARFRSSIGARR